METRETPEWFHPRALPPVPPLDPWGFLGALVLLASASAVVMGAIAFAVWL